MIFSFIQFITLVGFSFIISQPVFYLLAFTKVQQQMRASSYIELRNLIDRNLAGIMRVIYYGTLVATFLLVIISIFYYEGFRLVSSLIAFCALLTDMYFLISGNLPVNKVIGSWTSEHYPADWASYRTRWFYYFRRRQLADFIAFFSLLAAAIF